MAKTTFTLTNVAPQYSNFNQRAWTQIECLVKNYIEMELSGEYVYVITGTHGVKTVLNTDDKSKYELAVPEYYWSGLPKTFTL